MATIIQISKIQLRRGPEEDLPGAPSSVNPIILKPGLDIAEMAFSTDTQRIFIGTNPAQGNPNFERTSFPYQNIEVLTEFSTTANQNIYDDQTRDVQSAFIASSTLASTSTWTNVPIPDPDDNTLTTTFQIDLSAAGGANGRIEYFLFDETLSVTTPMRSGVMTISSNPSSTPSLTDDYTSSLPANASGDPVTTYGGVAFMATTVSTSGGNTIILQYQNLSAYNPIMMFRIDRANPASLPVS